MAERTLTLLPRNRWPEGFLNHPLMTATIRSFIYKLDPESQIEFDYECDPKHVDASVDGKVRTFTVEYLGSLLELPVWVENHKEVPPVKEYKPTQPRSLSSRVRSLRGITKQPRPAPRKASEVPLAPEREVSGVTAPQSIPEPEFLELKPNIGLRVMDFNCPLNNGLPQYNYFIQMNQHVFSVKELLEMALKQVDFTKE